MADTTNDIWNDNDGEEDEAPRKGGRLRRFGIFFLVLAAVLGVVLVAAYRDGTGFDALRRLFSYGSGEESTAEAQYDYDASDSNRFAVLGDSLVVLSDTKLQVLARGGEEIWSTSVRMSAPALETGGGRAVAYDAGGTELYVVDEDGAVVFQHPWLRLCRRIVRDYKFRGSDANFTLKMWPNVRRGEKLYISPYKENADLMFDSSLPDEMSVLKPFVVPLLEALPQGKYPIADDILRGYEKIASMDEAYIAPNSLVREFIGGSIYPS